MAGTVNFFNEDFPFKLKNKIKLRGWIKQMILEEGYTLGELNFIFCSDEYLLKINKQYLNHDTLTDIITFDNSEIEKQVVGDIFISYERILENASEFSTSEITELHRVIAHGTLHLLGYNDKKPLEKSQMTKKEDHYLQMRQF